MSGSRKLGVLPVKINLFDCITSEVAKPFFVYYNNGIAEFNTQLLQKSNKNTQ